jgi:PAS domain S-box-containing protein
MRRVSVGGVNCVLVAVRDIIDRKRAEEALRAANEELERRVVERTAELAETNMALEEEVAEHEAAREQLLEAERVLREREEHFRRLIESAHDLIQTLDAQGRITYSSPSVERLLGYAPEEITSLGIPDFLHPDDQANAYAEGGGGDGEPGQHRRAGVPRAPQGWRVPLDAGVGTHAVAGHGGARPGGQRARHHGASGRAGGAAPSEEHFRRLIENSSDYIMVVDETAAITYVGPSSERLLGYPPKR